MSLVTRTPALFSSRLTFSLIFLLQLIYPWKAWCPLHPLPGSIADGSGLSFLTPPMGICTGSLCYSQVTCPCFHFLNANNCLPHSFFMVVHDRRMKGNGYELTQENFSLDKEKPSPHLVHVLKWQCVFLSGLFTYGTSAFWPGKAAAGRGVKHYLHHTWSLDQQCKLISWGISVPEQAFQDTRYLYLPHLNRVLRHLHFDQPAT